MVLLQPQFIDILVCEVEDAFTELENMEIEKFDEPVDVPSGRYHLHQTPVRLVAKFVMHMIPAAVGSFDDKPQLAKAAGTAVESVFPQPHATAVFGSCEVGFFTAPGQVSDLFHVFEKTLLFGIQQIREARITLLKRFITLVHFSVLFEVPPQWPR